MNGARNVKNFFGPAPWGHGEGSKGQISFISITKSISKIFIPNFVCVPTNERYKTYQTFFYSVAWVMPQGWDFGALGVCPGGQKNFLENILNRIFILLPRSCPGVGLRGAGGVKNFCVGICDGAPLTARSSLNLKF